MTILWLLLGCGGAVERPLDARMALCPPSPNCVSSLADPSDEQHHVPPLPGDLDRARSAALSLPRARVLADDEDWVHIVVTTQVFGFHDDLELQADGGVVHVRSASRIGRSDLGVNRRRVASLRDMLEGTEPVRPPVGGEDGKRRSP